jgi:hypothetical protein
MKKILLLSPALFMVLAGCTTYYGNPPPAPTGNFSNSSLNGQYTYRLVGLAYTLQAAAIPYAEAGVFVADGSGHITGGTDDFVESGGVLATNSISGTYEIDNDGTGNIVLNNTSFGTIGLAVTLASPSKLYLIEQDPANTFGVAEKQDPSTLSTLPGGTFAFRIHDQATASRVGALNIVNGAITGSEDVLVGGVLNNNSGGPLTLTGSLDAPSAGRGSGSFNDGTATVQFEYYIVDSNNIRILRTDSGLVSLGRAEAQSGGPFTNASFLGSYAFGSRADDGFSVNGVNTVGLISGDGNGNISGGIFDSVADGNDLNGVTINPGTYGVSPAGRATVNFTTSASTSVQQVFWFVSPSRAFFLTNDPAKEEDGIADLQQSSSFSDSSLNGQYAFVMDGFIAGSFSIDRVGWINGDGAGNLRWYEAVNDSGSYDLSGTLYGTYTVAANGRVLATVTGLSQSSNDLVFYMISGDSAYILQTDFGYEILGAMDLQ